MNVGLWKILSYFLHQAPFLPFPFFFFWTKLHLTLFFPAQMATPGRRLCTSGKGARLRLGTFARGGSTSSPLWAWETPPRLSGLSQVRKKKIYSFWSTSSLWLIQLKLTEVFAVDILLVSLDSHVCVRIDFSNTRGASQEERSHRCCMTQHLCWAWYN